jgi:ribosomal protein S6--L-glutamate ligase
MVKVLTAVSSVGLVRSRDKLNSLQLLARAGVDLPKTVFTNCTKEIEHVIDSVGGTP